MRYLDGNLAVLARTQPELSRILSAARSGSVEVRPSARGLPTARCLVPSGGSVQLHSRFDPLKEARNVVRNSGTQDSDYVIILGLGLGYIIDALLELEISHTALLFVVEADLEVLRAAFESRDLRSLLIARRIWFAWPSSGPDLAVQWGRVFDPVSAQRATVVSWPPSLSLHPEFYRSATEVIQSQTSQVFTDINTLVAKSEAFLENFVQNIAALLPAPGVRHLGNRFPGVPAVIVSAGPSLDRNLHELRGRDDGALLLATDTALKPLLSAGVEPHIICTADPTYANYRHLEGAHSPNALLVAEATTHPGSLRDFAGRLIACTFEDSSLHGLNDILGNKGQLRAWGSVATMVLDLAVKAGCDPIIFIGQDLAFTDGRLYCSGVYFEREWFADVTTPQTWKERLRELRSTRKLVKMADIFGNEVETSTTLVSYWNWFQKELSRHPDRTFINATEGGILGGEGIRIMSLREALFRFCAERTGLRESVLRWHATAPRAELHDASRALSRLSKEHGHVSRTVAEALGVTAGAVSTPVAQSASRLEALKESLYTARHLAPILDSLNQMGNVAFLRGRAALAREQGVSRLRATLELYTAYFRSVLAAAERVRSALERIRESLAGIS